MRGLIIVAAFILPMAALAQPSDATGNSSADASAGGSGGSSQ